MQENTQQAFREVMRGYPTGVTIVTSLSEAKPVGGTMNSFTSVSMTPPLIAVFITAGSHTAQAIAGSRKFNVNILSASQETDARKFADPDSATRFAQDHFESGSNGIPVIPGSIACLECTLEDQIPIADHIMFLGNVTAAYSLKEGNPILYYRRKFRELPSNP